MMREAWQVELLGALRVRRPDEPDRAISRFPTQRTGLLLAYLAYHREQFHPRDYLAELLWPESEPASGRLNLRVALSALRRQLEPPGAVSGRVLIADRSTIRLDPERVTTD